MTIANDANDAAFKEWCLRFKNRPAVGGVIFEAGRRHPDGSYFHHYRKLVVRAPLPMPRVFLHGPRWRRFLVTYRTKNGRLAHHPSLYDFADDVRELVLEPIRFDVYAEWADAREKLGHHA